MNTKEEELVRNTFHGVLQPQLIDLILEKGRIWNVRPEEAISRPGQHIQEFFIVLKGVIKILRPSEEGGDMLMYYLTSGEACALSITCCMTTRRSEVSAVAEEDSALLAIPIQYAETWITEFPSWKRLIFGTFQKRFNDMLTTIDSIAYRKMDDRLMDYLIQKKLITGSNVINATHGLIAQELNTSREVVSRLLKQLEKIGRVSLGRNRIEILDQK